MRAGYVPSATQLLPLLSLQGRGAGEGAALLSLSCPISPHTLASCLVCPHATTRHACYAANSGSRRVIISHDAVVEGRDGSA
jgi:hypothetical protein